MSSEYIWYTPLSEQFLQRSCLLPDQTINERFNIIVDEHDRRLGIKGFKDEFLGYIKQGFYSLSTPNMSNTGTDRGLPISCFGTHIDDSMDSIADAWAEICIMTKMGGGTSAYFGDIRPRGAPIKDNGESSGAVHFMRAFDNLISLVSQGKTRRGNMAAYLPIDHPDVDEFLKIKSEGDPIQDLSFGVCVTRDWLKEMKGGDKKKRETWAKVLTARQNLGYPYIFFTDNANEGAPDCYRLAGMKINHSNLCTEIMLPNNSFESFVCNLSSMNLRYYDEWKNTNAVKLLTYFLDSVLSEFIDKAEGMKHMERPVNFAKRHRSIGIGVFGWHSYLQHNMIPYESMEAKLLNAQIFKTIQSQAYEASAELAQMFGEPEVCKGYGRRNSTLLAVAPTKSSAFVFGQESEGTEPFRTNLEIKDLAKGKFYVRNKYLEKLLVEKDRNTEETWDRIIKSGGSVQTLEFLSSHEKSVFKTFQEISPKEVIIQAAGRQKYIDQGQSINLMIHPDMPTKEVNALILFAEELGIKSLYYQYSVNAAQEFSRELLECVSCSA